MNTDGRRPLAMLNALEMEQIRVAQRMLEEMQRTVDMLRRGQRDVWRELRERHGLPPRFDFDQATGAIYPVRESDVGITPPAQEGA